ncbi:MAG: 16S rRNA (cytidine(1402)-2'-O)-methyltransferase [Gammaproteobacteria bacterium]|nr:16S rRNA (cytidine(1402)-2'-O)-methyltransferase [Gammaproteobacteria bacterium]
MQQSGTLYIIPTPIGNLGDITLRAIETLSAVDMILCEDTRHSKPLLAHFGIQKTVMAYHEHNERESLHKILEMLQKGKNLGLISDAGTPLISDPGFVLIRELRAHNIPIVALPGACALITALSASGLPTDKFRFEGFLPAKSKARQDRFSALKGETSTIIFYESTHRIVDMLSDLQVVMPEREVVLAKELTKAFESIISGKASDILTWLSDEPVRQKGEFAVLIAGHQQEETADAVLAECEKVLTILLVELPLKQAVKIAVELTGQSKNTLYELALSIQKPDN